MYKRQLRARAGYRAAGGYSGAQQHQHDADLRGIQRRGAPPENRGNAADFVEKKIDGAQGTADVFLRNVCYAALESDTSIRNVCYVVKAYIRNPV